MTLNHLPDWLTGEPWVKCPPAARFSPMNVSPGCSRAWCWRRRWSSDRYFPHLEGSGHLGDTPLVASALKLRGQEYAEAIARHVCADQTRAQGQHVGVVVQTGQPGARGVMAERGTDVTMAVGGNGYPDTGAADQHPAPRPAITQCFSQRVGKVGVVDRAAVAGFQIQQDESQASQFFDQEFLQVESGMVAGNSNRLGHGGDRASLAGSPEQLPYVAASQQPATSHGSYNI